MNTVSAKATAQSVSAAELVLQIAALEADMPDLQAEADKAAFEALTAPAGSAAAKRYDTASKELREAQDRLAMLQRAHSAALLREAAGAAAARDQLRQAQIAAVRTNLRERDQAAEEMCEAINIACKRFKTVVEKSAKAMQANPAGGTWPLGSKCQLGEIKRLVAAELWRLGGDPRIGGQTAFPGGHAGPMEQHNPDAIVPLTETIKKASAYVLAELTRKPIAAPAATAAADAPVAAASADAPQQPPRVQEPKVTRTAAEIQAGIKPAKLAV